MKRTVLVTGSSGFIGSHSVTALHAAGWTVTGVDRKPPRQKGEWETIIADAADPRVLARVAGGEFAVVVHQAAITDTTAAEEESRWSNAMVPLRIARACIDSRTRLVYASSGAVYGNVPHGVRSLETDIEDRGRCSGPLDDYALAKLVVEQEMLRRAAVFDLDCVGLRYSSVFGPGEELKGPAASMLWQVVTTAAAGSVVRLFGDTLAAARDYLPVQDLVATLVRLLDNPQVSGLYNLGSGIPVRFGTLLGWCTEWAGRPIPTTGVLNPLGDRYRYWTCTDMQRLYAALPGGEPMTIDTVRGRARDLFEQARAASTAGPGQW